MRQLLTDADKSLLALFAENEVSGGGSDPDYSTTIYDPEQPVLLNTLDELGDEDVAGAWESVILGKKMAAADSGDYAVI